MNELCLLKGLTVVGCCIGSRPLSEKSESKNTPKRRGKITTTSKSDDIDKEGTQFVFRSMFVFIFSTFVLRIIYALHGKI